MRAISLILIFTAAAMGQIPSVPNTDFPTFRGNLNTSLQYANSHVNGVTYPSAPSVDTVPMVTVSNGVSYVSIPACVGAIGYNNSTHTFSCSTTLAPSAHASTHGSAGSDPVALDASQVTTGILAAARLPGCAASGGSHGVGLLPDAGASAGTTRFLREDCSWAAINTGNASQLQGRALASTAPSNNQVLGWSVGSNQWQPLTVDTGIVGENGNLYFTNARAIAAVNVMTTLGDLMYGGASGVLTRLAGDTSNARRFLRGLSSGSVAAAPVWDAVTATDVGLGNVANVDTTNAANIASGTLPAGRLPNPSSSTFGGVQSKSAVSSNWLRSLGTDGIFTASRPAVGDLSDAVTVITTSSSPASGDLTGTFPNLSIASTTGTGAFVRTASPVVVTPTIASFANATHDHTNAAGGGVLTTMNGIAMPSSVNSGGVPYFSSSSAMASGPAWTVNTLLKGGGAGVAPSVTGVTVDSSNNISTTGSITTTLGGTFRGTLDVGNVLLQHGKTQTLFVQSADTDSARWTAVTSAFTASAAGDQITVGPGNYSVGASGVNILDDQVVEFQGSVITNTVSTVRIITSSSTNRWAVNGGKFIGVGFGGGTLTDEAAIYVTGTFSYWRVTGSYISAFRGVGIYVNGTTAGGNRYNAYRISNCTFDTNRVGFWAVAFAEYGLVTNNSFVGNALFGARTNAGNIIFESNTISGNGFDASAGSTSGGLSIGYTDPSGNNAHGLIVGNTINHNAGCGVLVEAVVPGEQIVGNSILANSSGGVCLISAIGVRMTGNNMGGNGVGAVRLTGGFRGYNYVDNSFAYSNAFTVSGTAAQLAYLIVTGTGDVTVPTTVGNTGFDSVSVPARILSSPGISATSLKTVTVAPIDPSATAPYMWFNANNLGLGDGAAVGTWTDDSGNGRNATQATAGAKPTFKTSIINGKSVVRFSGSNSVVTASLSQTQPITIFFVAQHAANATTVPFSWAISTGGLMVFPDSTTGGMILQATTTNVYGSALPTSWTIYEAVWNGASSTLTVNGVQTGSGTTAGNTNGVFTIGNNTVGNAGFVGDIAEIIVWNSTLSAGNTAGVRRYLMDKYMTSAATVSVTDAAGNTLLGVTPSGAVTTSTVNYIATEGGANNAITGTLTGVPLVDGLCVQVLLAHTLQAGANTFALNGGSAVSIKSSRNVASDIGTAYAATGRVNLCYKAATPAWMDTSQ